MLTLFTSPITYALRALSIFYPPQKPLVFAGAASANSLAKFLLAAGQQRPQLVTDRFLAESGMLDGLRRTLEQGGAQVAIFSDIAPNPTLATVEAGVEASQAHRADAILAVGGGSAIDAAKVIAAASADGRSPGQLAGILKLKAPTLPFYVVPTTSGTGSEVTTAAVISDSQTHKKKFFVDPKYIPTATALDPQLLKSLPKGMTAATGMDALTHAIEAYTSRNRFRDTDRDASLAIKLLFEHLPRAHAHGDDLEARQMVAWASFLAGYAFTKSSLGYVHAISHQLSAHYNTPHGLTNAVILPRVLRFNLSACASRYAKLERMLSGDDVDRPDRYLATRFLARVDRLADAVEIPLNLPQVQESDFGQIAKEARAEARANYAVPKRMSGRHIQAVLRAVASGDRELATA